MIEELLQIIRVRLSSQKTIYNKLVSKLDVSDGKKPSASGQSLKRSIIWTNKVLEKKLKSLPKRYPILVDWARILITNFKY